MPDRKPDDIAYVNVTTSFDWIDRFRILFGREPRQRIAVSVWFPEEAQPYMYVESEASIIVPTIFPRRQPAMFAPVDGAAVRSNADK